MLSRFDEAAADACEFLGIPRAEFFARAQSWIDEINRDGPPLEPSEYYRGEADARAADWICANVWLQFSSIENWNALQYLRNLSRADCLDFGCGTAALSFALHPQLRSLCLCDVPNRIQEFVNWRIRRRNAGNVSVKTPEQVNSLPQFQIVFALDVFEHLPDSSAVFAELDRHVAPNGVLIFNAPWASQFNIREHLPEAEADWLRPGGGAELLSRHYVRRSALPHGGLYEKNRP